MRDWLIQNRQWVFSGCGVAIIAGVVAWLRSKRDSTISQTQRSGAHSTNIQAGRDANVTLGDKGKGKHGR